jgi:hypothetical protein
VVRPRDGERDCAESIAPRTLLVDVTAAVSRVGWVVGVRARDAFQWFDLHLVSE